LSRLAAKIKSIMAHDPNTRDIYQSWRQPIKLLHPVLAEAQAERNAIGPGDVANVTAQLLLRLRVGVYPGPG
jgi:hypothetical protein